jgi:hypothetical protein
LSPFPQAFLDARITGDLADGGGDTLAEIGGHVAPAEETRHGVEGVVGIAGFGPDGTSGATTAH